MATSPDAERADPIFLALQRFITNHKANGLGYAQLESDIRALLATALREAEVGVVNELLRGLFEGQTDAEWLAHATRYRGGSAESWTVGTLIQRAITLRRRAASGKEERG